MTIDGQISMDDLIREEEEQTREKITLPPVTASDKETVYKIPDDVWEGRCRFCIHKNAQENAPVSIRDVYKQQYADLIPCRIMSVSRPNDKPGECMSFAPRMDTFGICGTCKHDNIFCDGFCMKANHAEQRRVFYGQDYGGDEKKRDYWGRHRLSVCDDYEPDDYAKEGKF